jgi:hypothetical protein
VLDVGEEVLVHLEDVDRHAHQVGQRGPSGPEVVDGDADAELPQHAEVLDDVAVVEQHRLGDLDDQARGRQAAGFQGRKHVGHEFAAAHLAGRDVDRDAAGILARAGVSEGRDRGARLAQHPAAEVGDERRLLGQRDELDGGDVTEDRVPPAQQRLDGDRALQHDVDDGLEDQAQLAAGQCSVEVGAQGAAAVLREPEGVVVAVDRAGAVGPRAAQGQVPVAEGLAGVDVVGQRGDAGRGRQPHDAPGGAQRAHGGDEAGGDDLGVGDAAVDEDDEVAVLAAGQPVLTAECPGQAGRDRAQHGGLGAGREQVVVQPVDADQGQREAAAELGALQRAEPADQRGAVGQPGDRVGERQLEEFGVDVGDRGARDVAAVQHQSSDLGVGAQVADGGLDQPPAAVGVPDAGGADGQLVVLARRAVQRAQERGGVVRVDGGIDGPAEDARGIEPEQVGDGLGDEGDPQPLVEDHDGVDAALDQRSERRLAAVQGTGQPGLPVPEHGLGAGQRDSSGDRDQERGGVDAGDCQHGGDDGGESDQQCGDGEQPGAPAAGRGRERSRRLPQTQDGHVLSFGRSAARLQHRQGTVTPSGGPIDAAMRTACPPRPAVARGGECDLGVFREAMGICAERSRHRTVSRAG